MKPARWWTLFPVLLLVLGGTACDDDSPVGDCDLGGLDPAAVVDAVNGLFTPLDASDDALANLAVAIDHVQDAGVQFRRLAPTNGPGAAAMIDRVAGIAPALTTPLPVEFPPEVAGSTFAYDPAVFGWVVDESRTDAPENGVRIIWYPMEDTEVDFALGESGYIDLTPGPDTTLNQLRMEVVRVDGEETRLLDFTQGYRETTGGSVETTYMEAVGSFADSTGQVAFSIVTDESSNADTGASEYSVEAEVERGTTLYTITAGGAVDGETDAFEDSFDVTLTRDAVTTNVELVVAGSGQTREDATGTLLHDGEVVAGIVLSGNTYVFTDVDGDQCSPGQSTALNDALTVMLLRGLFLTLDLPLLL
ncbi:MAG: hypothetical protein ACLFRX_05500 [Gemmatimonadota bacterium]